LKEAEMFKEIKKYFKYRKRHKHLTVRCYFVNPMKAGLCRSALKENGVSCQIRKHSYAYGVIEFWSVRCSYKHRTWLHWGARAGNMWSAYGRVPKVLDWA
jgi:ribosomal protein L40E